MNKLLFLVHRIPYPPNKGDKIRSFHLLKYLASNYQVYLGTFVDDKEDLQHVKKLEGLCCDFLVRPLSPLVAKLRSLSGFLSNEALSIPYYRDIQLQKWVSKTVEQEGITHIVVFSSVMAQYISVEMHTRCITIVDHVDVDSDKWIQFGQCSRWPFNIVYRREGRRLLKYEKEVAVRADYNLFVSENEANLFKKLAPTVSQKVDYVNNGVDSNFFSPHRHYSTPYESNSKVIVFTGAMDYWPNVDAVHWFVTEVLPIIVAAIGEVSFYIVGARPKPSVSSLTENRHVSVTGQVEDVRPYLAHAKVSVAPLRIARGVQNKVLEAMSMKLPVVATECALNGIEHCEVLNRTVADNAHDFARHTIERVLRSESEEVGDKLRDFVIEQYDWSKNLQRFSKVLDRSALASSV